MLCHSIRVKMVENDYNAIDIVAVSALLLFFECVLNVNIQLFACECFL